VIVSADWVLPIDRDPIERGAVEFEDGRIVAVGTAEELGAGKHYDDSVILPGFVNAHSHLEYAVYGGFGDGLDDFAEWISRHVERKARIGFDEHVDIARLGAAKCLASGVTTVGDCSYSGAAAVACAELGLRAHVYLEVFGSDVDRALERFARTREHVATAFDHRVRPGVSPHAPYSVSLSVYEACSELGLPIATHISESAAEVAFLRDGGGAWGAYADLLVEPPGATGARMLADAGLPGPDVVAAHCVVVEPDEVETLAESGTGIAHCPRSNAALGCGVAPLGEFLRAGARVGVGTDSPASTPSFDFYDELRSVVLSARARERRAGALSAADALELATLGSARALNREPDLGPLTPGQRPDLQVVSPSGPPWLPWEDPAAAVVFGGSPERILATFVDGETRYEKGGLEWHELTAAAHNARRALLALATATPAAANAPPPRAR